MKKKAIIMAILVAAIMILPVNAVWNTKNVGNESHLLSNQTVIHAQKISKANVMKGPTLKMEDLPDKIIKGKRTASMDGDVQVTTGDNDQLHPAIATSSDGNMLTLYEDYVSIFDGDILAASSSDGQNWQPAGGFNIADLRESMPAIDIVNGREAIGTWVPDPRDGTEGGMLYYAQFGDITDSTTWDLGHVDWGGYGFTNINSVAASGYGLTDKPTQYFNGLWSATLDSGYSGYEEDHTIIYSYNTDQEGYVQLIFWYGFGDDMYNISADIDQSNGMAYWVMEAYNESDYSTYRVRALYTYIDPSLGEDWWNGEYYGFAINDSIHPDVAAAGGIVYIVAEQIEMGFNHNIICAYSSDNGKNWSVAPIANTGEQETNPSIYAYSGGAATCLFMKNGDLYVSHTADGGATWTEPEKVSDSSSVVEEYHAADVSRGGNAVWMDNRNGNDDIYYDNVGIPAAVMNIESIKGGFGVTATIKNVGGVDGKNIPWSISLSGLVFVGKEKSGTIDIAVGEEQTIKTGFILGIGPVTVTVNAGGTTATAKGFLLGPLVLGLK